MMPSTLCPLSTLRQFSKPLDLVPRAPPALAGRGMLVCFQVLAQSPERLLEASIFVQAH